MPLMTFLSLRSFGAALLAAGALVISGCATTTVQQSSPAPAPYRSPLAGNEIVERLKGGANQAELTKEIQARGVANVTAADFDAIKAAGASPDMQNAVLASLQKANPAPQQQTTTYVYRDYWGAAIPWWWAPHFGWHWHYYRRR